MKGVTLGSYHSYRDLKMIMTEKEIGSPDVKTMKVPIDGADGTLDLTDFFGEPKYDDVKHKFGFETILPKSEFLSQFSKVKNAIHGKKDRIILDDDPSFFYMGRCFVSSFTNEKNVGKIRVECECEPYKYMIEKTVVRADVDGTQDITLTNARKRAVPEVSITTDGTLHIVFDTYNIWDLGSGSFTLPELELREGDNVVTVTGTGTIAFTWQEGEL